MVVMYLSNKAPILLALVSYGETFINKLELRCIFCSRARQSSLVRLFLQAGVNRAVHQRNFHLYSISVFGYMHAHFDP